MLNNLLLASGDSGEKLYVEDVFSTYLYTGNGSTQTITNGIDLAGKGGMVWTKRRDATGNHWAYSTAQGTGGKGLLPNTADNISIYTTYNNIQSFNSDGFTLGTATSGNQSNTSGGSFASWTFRKAPKFFDVLTWTGTGGTGSITLNHSLGVAPGLVIIKKTNDAEDWTVWHRSLGTDEYLVLNSTSAKQTLTGIGPAAGALTASTITIPQYLKTSGATYVAYLFAHDTTADGIVQCGSFNSGSGSGTVTLGWEPQFILRKSSSAADNWTIVDNMRGAALTYNAWLVANTSGAEQSAATPYLAPTATGFSFSNSGSNINYIYLAIRRGPMRTPTDATKVFAPDKYAESGSSSIGKRTYGFAPDVAWQTRLSGGYSYFVWDKLRGLDRVLQVPNTSDENQFTAYPFGGFDNTGLTPGFAFNNTTGETSSILAFKRAPGFFDVVCYSGTGSARTVSHNLGVAPEFMIVKRRDTSGYPWAVYHKDIGITSTSGIRLNTNDGNGFNQTTRFSSTPTATEMSLGSDSDVNQSGGTYVAYLFATCPGVSKVGSYTGTGTTKQIDCGFSNGARFVLIKRYGSGVTGDWWVFDTARGIISGNDPSLLLNSTAAEVTNTDYIDPYSAGFELSSTAPAGLNANGGTYIYLAIA